MRSCVCVSTRAGADDAAVSGVVEELHTDGAHYTVSGLVVLVTSFFLSRIPSSQLTFATVKVCVETNPFLNRRRFGRHRHCGV
jgi:hypothetical protein